MQVLAKLLVCALALAAVTTDAAATIRKGCDDADANLTPLPTAGKPDQTTPAPTTGKPDQTTPAPSSDKPVVTTAAPTTEPPATTTPAPATTTPAPATTTPAPAPGTFDSKKEYTSDGSNCNGYLRLPQPGKEISRADCQVDFSVKFTSLDVKLTQGCAVCEGGRPFVYDNSTELSAQSVPLCGGLPLCTRFGGYYEVTEYDLMCVLRVNGAAPVEDAKVCALGDN